MGSGSNGSVVETVELGGQRYQVIPQQVGYLQHRLGDGLEDVLDAGLSSDGANQLAGMGKAAHEILSVFIPDLMPLHTFLGYGSAEAMEARTYDAHQDHSPTVLEIRDAFSAAARANGGELLSNLKKMLGTELIRKGLALAISQTASQRLPKSPPASGASGPTNSGADGATDAPRPPQDSSAALSGA